MERDEWTYRIEDGGVMLVRDGWEDWEFEPVALEECPHEVAFGMAMRWMMDCEGERGVG